MHFKTRFPRQHSLHQLRQHPHPSPPQQLCKVHRWVPNSYPGQIQVSLTSLSQTIDDYHNMAKREIIVAKQEKAFSSLLFGTLN